MVRGGQGAAIGLLLSMPLLLLSAPRPAQAAEIVAVPRLISRDTHLTPEQAEKATSLLEVECGYRTTPRSQIRAWIEGQKAESYKPCYDEACQIELGKAVSADRILAAEWSAFENEGVLTLRPVFGTIRLEGGAGGPSTPQWTNALPTVDKTPPVIAVFVIKNDGTRLKPGELERLTDYLSAKLAATRQFQVVPKSEVKAALTRKKLESYQACYAEACQIEVGKEVAAEKTLTTQLQRFGDRCVLSLTVYDLRSAASMGGSTARGSCLLGELPKLVDTAVASLVDHRPPGVAPSTGPDPSEPSPNLGTEENRRLESPTQRRAAEDPIAAIEHYLRRANRDCELRSVALVYQGLLRGAALPVIVATYGVEGCGGGNNWKSTFGVFTQKEGLVRQLELPRVDGWSSVERVSVVGDLIAVESKTYAPDDPRCCPSLVRRYWFGLRDGLVVAQPPPRESAR